MNTPVQPPPPSSSGPVPQAIPAPTSGTGTLVQLPPNLPPLENGQSLAATVIARAAPGQFQVQLESGVQLTIQTALALANGSSVTLQIQTLGQPPQVAILLGNEGAFAPGGQGQAAAGAPLPGGTPAPTIATDTTTLTQGAIVTATVTRVAAAGQGAAATAGQTAAGATGAPSPTAAAAGGATGAAAATAAPGATSPLAAAASVVTPQSGTTSPAAGTAAGSQTAVQSGPRTGAQAGPTAGGTPGAAQAATSAALPQGTTVAVRILTIVPPGGSAPSATAHPGGTSGAQVVSGTVSGANTAGQTVVQTPIGELTLSANNALPVGSRMILSFAGTPQTPVQIGYDGAPIGLNQQWDALRQAIAALQQNNPAAARTLIQQVLPQPGAQLTSSTLFFLAALIGGDIRRWFGEDTARAMERGGLLGRIEEEFGRVRGLSSDAGAQDWRTYLIPLMSSSGMEQIKLFVRDDGGKDQDGDADQEPGTRFVVEVEFSHLGPFQFDGLTRRKNIDMIVRTQQALSDDMRRDINRIYTNTVSALGFTGEIAFQVTAAFDLNPLHEIGRDTMGVTV